MHPPPAARRRLMSTCVVAVSGCALFLSGCTLFSGERGDVVRVDTSRHSHLAKKANAEGLHWLDTGDLALAKHAFEKAIRHDPHFAPAHNNLGQMLFDAGDMARAAAAFDTALKHNPNNPVPHNNLGLALENGGKPEEALAEYQAAYDLDPTNPEFLGNLVRVRMKLDPWDESVVGHLTELRFIENRQDWVEWIEEQLAVRHNPYLDRGPPDPDLSELDGTQGDGKESRGVVDVIEEVSLTDESLPAPAPATESDVPNMGELPPPRPSMRVGPSQGSGPPPPATPLPGLPTVEPPTYGGPLYEAPTYEVPTHEFPVPLPPMYGPAPSETFVPLPSHSPEWEMPAPGAGRYEGGPIYEPPIMDHVEPDGWRPGYGR